MLQIYRLCSNAYVFCFQLQQTNLMASTNPFLANSNVNSAFMPTDFSQPQLVQVGITMTNV